MKFIKIPGQKTEFANSRCYARGDSNCSTKISKEHFISESYLRQGELENSTKIAGLAWQKPETFDVIPTKALASNILCERHNSALSPLDQAFSELTETIRGFDTEVSLSDETVPFSGNIIELWMLKCVVGLSISGNMKSNIKSECVDILFGRKTLPNLWGMYCSGSLGSTVYHTSSFVVELRTSLDKLVLAADFFIQGLPFTLLLGKPGNPRSFGIRRPGEIVFRHPKCEKRILFSWDKSKRQKIELTKQGTYDGFPPNWKDWEKRG